MWTESRGIELQKPFSPCLVTRNPNFMLRNVELAQTDNIPHQSYHKPHAACSQEHMLTTLTFGQHEHFIPPHPLNKMSNYTSLP